MGVLRRTSKAVQGGMQAAQQGSRERLPTASMNQRNYDVNKMQDIRNAACSCW